MARHPFTQDDKKAIEDAIRLIDEMQPTVAKAKNCGVDCDEIIRRMNANRKKLSSFITQFWPEGDI